MAKPPAFQFYASDFLVDVAEFKSCEVGVYIRLLATQWVNGDLPKESTRLAVICGEDISNFHTIWEIIRHKFEQNNQGRLVNKRMEEVRYNKKRTSDGASKAGESSAASKKFKITEITWPWDNESFKEKWAVWKQYKKDTFKFQFKTLTSEQINLNCLYKDSGGNMQYAIDWIDNAIKKQWQGIYEPRDYRYDTNNKSTKERTSYNASDLNKINSSLKGLNS